MPLPLFFIAGAVATAVGVKKTNDAKKDNNYAKQINMFSEHQIELAKKNLDFSRDRTSELIKEYGHEKLFILNNSIFKFVESYDKIINIKFSKIYEVNEDETKNSKNTFEELKNMVKFASSFETENIDELGLGFVTAFGAYSLATTIATISSSTTIASLSGVASNATLAFLSSGSIAAGGVGILGGLSILGGLVSGPAFMVMGFVSEAKAKKNLSKALENKMKSREIVLELNKVVDMCDKISRRTMVYYNLLARLDAYLIRLVYKLEEIIKEEGIDYSKYSEDSKALVIIIATVANTIKSVLNIPILNEDGSLTEESESFIEDMYNESSYEVFISKYQ